MSKKHIFSEVVDKIPFTGTYIIEEDYGYSPIFSLCTITIDNRPDLMLVIDPRVVQEIEKSLLLDWEYNVWRV